MGYAPCFSRREAAARSHASGLKEWFSRRPSWTLSHRERKKVVSYAGVQLNLVARLSIVAVFEGAGAAVAAEMSGRCGSSEPGGAP